ncbi:tyrosine-type recombinase/integrase [Pirellulaceae bacterium]|nr:tyrosine-type recombinase/integrase [Pirellulaceae bacterium]
MASLSITKRNGKTCYQIWIGSEPNRFNIWLGKISKSHANEIFSNIAHLESATGNNAGIRQSTYEWLDAVDDKLHQKLVNAKLAQPRSATRIKEFFADRLKSLNCSDRTRDIYYRAHLKFFEFLNGENPLVRDVTEKQASDFYEKFLVDAGMSESYRSKTARIIREFFGRAVKLKLIRENPFSAFQISDHVDRSRHVYIDRDTIHKLIDSGLDARWRCLLGFSALCGLRTRSEVASIRWEQINWDENTFTVAKGKTAERAVPIFGDFRPLLDAYHQVCIAPDPLLVLSGPIFPHCPSQTQLTNRLNRTAAKAGIQPWQKPWMNLRSSVETWLVRQGFDLTTVTGWLGNSPTIAQKHYLQVTPGDIAKASGLAAPEKFSNSFQNMEESGRMAAQESKKPSEKRGLLAIQYTSLDSNQ